MTPPASCTLSPAFCSQHFVPRVYFFSMYFARRVLPRDRPPGAALKFRLSLPRCSQRSCPLHICDALFHFAAVQCPPCCVSLKPVCLLIRSTPRDLCRHPIRMLRAGGCQEPSTVIVHTHDPQDWPCTCQSSSMRTVNSAWCSL